MQPSIGHCLWRACSGATFFGGWMLRQGSPGRPRTPLVDQAGLRLRSASPCLLSAAIKDARHRCPARAHFFVCSASCSHGAAQAVGEVVRGSEAVACLRGMVSQRQHKDLTSLSGTLESRPSKATGPPEIPPEQMGPEYQKGWVEATYLHRPLQHSPG